jgi:hypothetical protein
MPLLGPWLQLLEIKGKMRLANADNWHSFCFQCDGQNREQPAISIGLQFLGSERVLIWKKVATWRRGMLCRVKG